MWLVQLMLISLVAGTILGLGWHMVDKWRARAEREHREMLEKLEPSEEQLTNKRK